MVISKALPYGPVKFSWLLYSWACGNLLLKKLIFRTLAFRFGKRAAHNEAKHNLPNVRVNILAQFVQYIYFVLYVKIILNFPLSLTDTR